MHTPIDKIHCLIENNSEQYSSGNVVVENHWNDHGVVLSCTVQLTPTAGEYTKSHPVLLNIEEATQLGESLLAWAAARQFKNAVK